MTNRLSNLQLLHPPAQNAWTRAGLHPTACHVRRTDGVEVEIEAPLFWYEPPWIRLECTLCDELAAAVAGQDIMVSALRRDLAGDDAHCELFAPQKIENDQETEGQSKHYLPRMTPYRAERYGLMQQDFDHTQVIDVRLMPARDHSGRLAYSPEQMERWERPGSETPLAGGGYVAAGAFPADVTSTRQLKVKLDQLRQLSPTAAVFVSIGPFRLDHDLTAALTSQPDGVIVRLNECQLDGLQLAALVYRCRRILNEQGQGKLPLWVVPRWVAPDDVAKLIALGASAVAVDSWCVPLIELLENRPRRSAYDRHSEDDVAAIVAERLWDDVDRVLGLLSSIPPDATPTQVLGSFSSKWAKACGVTLMS